MQTTGVTKNLVRGLGTFAVLLVEITVAISCAGELAVDEEVAHLGANLERIARGDNQVGNFSRFERAEPISEPEHLGGIDRHSLQGFVMGQAVAHSGAGVLREAARKCSAKAGKGYRDSSRVQFRGLAHGFVV